MKKIKLHKLNETERLLSKSVRFLKTVTLTQLMLLF